MSERLLWFYIGLVAIWIPVILASLLAPDLVSGSEQEHLPLPAMLTWIFGLIATGAMRRHTMRKSTVYADKLGAWKTGYGLIGVIWVIVMLVSIFGPVLETGSDPTSLPLAAIIAPVAGAVLTWIGLDSITLAEDE